MNDRLIAAILDPDRNIIGDIQKGSRYISDMNNARLDQILKGHQNTIYGEQARVAPQMADEGLKAQLLKNMIAQAEADIAPQKQRALLHDILAGTGLKHAQTRNTNLFSDYMPREKEAAIRKSELEAMYYPQKMLNERMKAQVGMMKHAEPFAKLEGENQFIKETGLNPATMRPINQRQQEKIIFENNLKQDNLLLSPDTRRFLEQAHTVDASFDKIDFTRIAKFFGPVGMSRRVKAQSLMALGKRDPDYELFRQFETQDAPVIAKQWRYMLKDSIQPKVAKSYLDMVNPDSWKTTPKMALKAFNNARDIFKLELKSKTAMLPKDSVTRQYFETKLKDSKPNFQGEPTPKQALAELEKRGVVT